MALLRLVLLFLVALLIVRVLRAFVSPGRRPAERRDADLSQGTDMIQDPVCEVYVPKSKAVMEKIDGETHYFCSERCAERFRKAAASAGPT